MLVDASAPNPLNAARSLDAQTQPRDCHVSESWRASGASAPISVASDSPAAVLSNSSTAQRGRCPEHLGLLHPIPYTHQDSLASSATRPQERKPAQHETQVCLQTTVPAAARCRRFHSRQSDGINWSSQ